jgi:DNA-binding transcriptional ArsR family regulator
MFDVIAPAAIFNIMVKNEEKLTAVFAALADPTRRKILQRLSGRREIRVTSLAKPFQMSLPAVSRHLRVLEAARLVKRERNGRIHLMRARIDGLQDAQGWIRQHIEFWESGFDALEELLASEKAKEQKEKERKS